jgi:conjugative transfer signal peptidase TraF
LRSLVRALSWHLGTELLGTLALLLVLPFKPPILLLRSPSLPLGLYLPSRSPVHAGSLVAVCLPKEIALRALRSGFLPPGACPSGVAPLAKIVLAAGGDAVDFTAAGLRHARRLLPGSGPLAFDSQGRPMTHAPFGRYRLHPHELWLYSPYHPRSFDSRYYGPVPDAGVLTTIRPLVIATRGLPQPPGFRLRRGHSEVF